MRLTPLLLLLSPLALLARAGPEPAPDVKAAVVKAYRALLPPEVTSHLAQPPPKGPFDSVDVSDRIRSASFGHRTTLLIPRGQPPGALVYFVRYGPSTNTKEATFGPFTAGVAPQGPGSAPEIVRCGARTCPSGQYCCNEACGVCAPRGVMCKQEHCGPMDAGAR